VELHPRSTKIEEAKDKLGKINTDIFLSPRPAPEKQIYVVKQGDVLNRVARTTRTTPELLMRANGLTGIILQINQRLAYTPADFSVIIHKKEKKVVLRNHGKFFKQYYARTMPPPPPKKGNSPSKPQQGKIVEKIAWGPSGNRVIFTDKEYAEATFWITHTIPGHTIYSEPDPGSGLQVNKPPSGGVGLAPADASELAIMVTKNNPVTLEN
jgi:LysM repeat protein